MHYHHIEKFKQYGLCQYLISIFLPEHHVPDIGFWFAFWLFCTVVLLGHRPQDSKLDCYINLYNEGRASNWALCNPRRTLKPPLSYQEMSPKSSGKQISNCLVKAKNLRTLTLFWLYLYILGGFLLQLQLNRLCRIESKFISPANFI